MSPNSFGSFSCSRFYYAGHAGAVTVGAHAGRGETRRRSGTTRSLRTGRHMPPGPNRCFSGDPWKHLVLNTALSRIRWDLTCYVVLQFKESGAYCQHMTTRAICYIRVSTDKQADHGVSLEAQEAKLRAYAELYDIQIVDTIVDAGASAKTLERPGLDKARGMLRGKKAEALLVVKLDRLTRSVKDLGALIESDFAPGKAALLSVSEQIDTRSAGGRLVLNILGSVSQWEREAIGERTASAMRHMREIGQYTGGQAPYGFALDASGELAEVVEERAVIREALELKASGLSLRAVAAELNRRGHVARSGKRFGSAQIMRMTKAAA
jgi:site-specific DNA recombinase